MTKREAEMIARVDSFGTLDDRLIECRRRIGQMCSEGRPPKMSIPTQWDDDDYFICRVIESAQAALAAQGDEPGVLGEIAAERKRQDAKWGGPEHDDTHTPSDWHDFISDRAGVLDQGGWTLPDPVARRLLVQIAALAVAAIESHDRLVAREGR